MTISNRISLSGAIDGLESHYGRPKAPKITDPWLLILWENVAYMADDERRAKAFVMLQSKVGTSPDKILAAPKKVLVEIASHGILAAKLYRKMIDCAQILSDEFDCDLSDVINGSPGAAKKALRKFPGIGEPGADKLLLFAQKNPVLALDSNGMRALVRLGFADEQKSYSSTYRLIQKAVEPEIKKDFDWLIRAHQLLRRHGQELCKRSAPICGKCPLKNHCRYFKSSAKA